MTTLYQLEDDYFSRSLQAEFQKYLVPILKPIYFKESSLPDQLLNQYIIDTFLTTLSWWLHAQPELEAVKITHFYLKLLA